MAAADPQQNNLAKFLQNLTFSSSTQKQYQSTPDKACIAPRTVHVSTYVTTQQDNEC